MESKSFVLPLYYILEGNGQFDNHCNNEWKTLETLHFLQKKEKQKDNRDFLAIAETYFIRSIFFKVS